MTWRECVKERGFFRGTSLWLGDYMPAPFEDKPHLDWVTDSWVDPLINACDWAGCKQHGHEIMVEMDNRTIVCVYCHRILCTADDREHALMIYRLSRRYGLKLR